MTAREIFDRQSELIDETRAMTGLVVAFGIALGMFSIGLIAYVL